MEAIRLAILRLPKFSKKSSTKIIIDDKIFRLHYTYTSSVFFFLTLVSSVLFLFDWVQCYSNHLHLPVKVLNTYCWMQNTFVLEKTGVVVAHPGVDKTLPESSRTYVTYYQWIPILFLCQGLVFRLPHRLWKETEHEETVNLVDGLQFPIAESARMHGPQYQNLSTSEHYSLVAEHLAKHWSKDKNKFRFYCGTVCLNLITVIGNIFILDWFFQTNFRNFSWRSLDDYYQYYNNRTDLMLKVFPRVVKCSYFDYGAGGSVQTYDIMCLLPFNVYNEKFFTLCMLWFIVLAVLTAGSLLMWLVLLLVPVARRLCLIQFMFPVKSAVKMMKNIEFNSQDWFLMSLISCNMHDNHLDKIIPELEVKLPLKKQRKKPTSDNTEETLI